MTENHPRIGELVTTPQERDAIHVAICPVLAHEKFKPREHIGAYYDSNLEEYVASRSTLHPKLGIVDPYLTVKIKEGDRFLMFLYPNTITSLKHNWTHPDLPDIANASRIEKDPNGIHLQWMEDFASRFRLTSFDMMEAADRYLLNNTFFNKGELFEGEWIPDEFWDHYEALKNTIVNNRGNFFTCSC
jgi:hypothetical protein